MDPLRGAEVAWQGWLGAGSTHPHTASAGSHSHLRVLTSTQCRLSPVHAGGPAQELGPVPSSLFKHSWQLTSVGTFLGPWLIQHWNPPPVCHSKTPSSGTRHTPRSHLQLACVLCAFGLFVWGGARGLQCLVRLLLIMIRNMYWVSPGSRSRPEGFMCISSCSPHTSPSRWLLWPQGSGRGRRWGRSPLPPAFSAFLPRKAVFPQSISCGVWPPGALGVCRLPQIRRRAPGMSASLRHGPLVKWTVGRHWHSVQEMWHHTPTRRATEVPALLEARQSPAGFPTQTRLKRFLRKVCWEGRKVTARFLKLYFAF